MSGRRANEPLVADRVKAGEGLARGRRMGAEGRGRMEACERGRSCYRCRHLSAAMPTYDYECRTCGHRFEVFQKMSDPKLTECPVEQCAGQVRRLLGTGAGLIFKGSGFYQTDYRSDSYKSGEKSANKKPESTGSSKPAESKSKPKCEGGGKGNPGGGSCGCAAA